MKGQVARESQLWAKKDKEGAGYHQPSRLTEPQRKPIAVSLGFSPLLRGTHTRARLCTRKVWNKGAGRGGKKAGNEMFFLGSSSEIYELGEER